MAKSHKLKDDNYWDSSAIRHNQKSLSNLLIGEKVEYAETVNVSTANTWYDVGISGDDLDYGTYIMEARFNSPSVNSMWGERASGVVAWYSGGTNSTDADEIPLSKAGHARNSHNVKFRVLRQRRKCRIAIKTSNN